MADYHISHSLIHHISHSLIHHTSHSSSLTQLYSVMYSTATVSVGPKDLDRTINNYVVKSTDLDYVKGNNPRPRRDNCNERGLFILTHTRSVNLKT